ncbi:MAG: hypothetical protein M0Z95_15270 [Actinomycetota bacterium]|nr:hypothetical protein [Actinomycetota bacterium]
MAGAATLGAFVCARNVGGGTLAESRTVATWALLVLGLVVLLMVARPLRPLRLLVVAVMAGGAVVVSGVPWFREVFALALPPPTHLVWSLVAVAVGVPLLLAAVVAGSRLARGEGAPRTTPSPRPPPRPQRP